MSDKAAKARRWAKENPLSAHDTGVADALEELEAVRKSRNNLLHILDRIEFWMERHGDETGGDMYNPQLHRSTKAAIKRAKAQKNGD